MPASVAARASTAGGRVALGGVRGGSAAQQLSGVSPLDPSDLAAVEAWYRADDLGLADNTGVTTWTDSKNSHDATKNTGSTPTYQSNEINGHGVVRLSSSWSDWFNAASVSIPQPCTVLVVAKAPSGTFFHVAVDGINAACEVGYEQTTTKLQVNATNARTSATTWGTTAFRLVTVVFNGSSSQAWMNGTAASAFTGNPGTNGFDGLRIGARRNTVNPGEGQWNGDIAEIILCNGVLARTDRLGLEAYALDRYGL